MSYKDMLALCYYDMESIVDMIPHLSDQSGTIWSQVDQMKALSHNYHITVFLSGQFSDSFSSDIDSFYKV